jgi:hypothetical protein
MPERQLVGTGIAVEEDAMKVRVARAHVVATAYHLERPVDPEPEALGAQISPKDVDARQPRPRSIRPTRGGMARSD